MRKLIVLGVSVLGLLVVGGVAMVQRSKARALEHQAEERRLRVKRAIDEAIRDIEWIKRRPEEVRDALRVGG